MVQRRGARFVKGNYRQTASVGKMLEDLNWQSLQSRRQKARLTTLYKIKNNLVAISNPDLQKPARRTRTSHADSFVQISTTRDFRKFSFFPRTITDWNLLPREVASSNTLEIFNERLNSLFQKDRNNCKATIELKNKIRAVCA